ncbi:hypothetical protein ABZS88_45545 [Streptomyces sp. NPDC005480]|uniref:STAS domain-containing protein n=1 Tax=Streptomyces sp. NPDC005480 TaxID=3154880 RepID=UPI0033A47B3C
MLITHAVEDDTLHVALHGQLDITSRAAAAVEIEALVRDRHPRRVTVQIPAGEPTPATFSALLRAHRMCKGHGIPLKLSGGTPTARRLFVVNTA